MKIITASQVKAKQWVGFFLRMGCSHVLLEDKQKLKCGGVNKCEK